jgi:integrase
MARQATGAIVEHAGSDGKVYRSLRFTAYGKRRRVPLGPVDQDTAERKLRIALDQVAEGTWQPPVAVEPPPEPEGMPTFHEFAEQWWLKNQGQLRPNTQTDYKIRLEKHLLPFFADYPLDRITFDLVERYIASSLAQSERIREAAAAGKPIMVEIKDKHGRRTMQPARSVSPRTINMTLILMAAILEGAVERELISRNPAKGKSRRAREHEPKRSYLETAQQVQALLDAAGQKDRQSRDDRRHVPRRGMIATLAFGGLRVSELTGLRWRDVDLATGWLHVSDSKTDAGRRKVKIRGALRDELLHVRARAISTEPDAFVFPTANGRQFLTNNVRKRVLTPAVELASEQLVERGYPPLPENITPHSLRRTFASVLYAIGEDPGIVMDEMGHTDPALALRVYRQSMRRDEGEKERLRALIDGVDSADQLANIGQQSMGATGAAYLGEAS